MQDKYKESGVDIDAGNEFVSDIKPLAKATSRIGANSDLGGFGGLFDLAACKYDDPVLVAANDGVGTKLKIAFEVEKHDTIGIDLVAMCVNDLVVQGAEPLFFLDYFATGQLEKKVAFDVVKGIADGCKLANAALIGGETAEMPGMYQDGHYDLAGFAVGAVERGAVLPKKNIQQGDVIIGLQSSGVHSNGYSLVRKILENNNISFSDKADFSEKTIGEILLEPTKIYVKSCLELIKQVEVKGLAHITGGGFTENIPRVLPDDLCAVIDLNSWKRSSLFKWLATKGDISVEEMLKTFNCGIGMIIIVNENNATEATNILNSLGEQAFEIGKIKQKSNQSVEYINKEF